MICKNCIHKNLCKDMHKFGIVDLPYEDYTAACVHFKPVVYAQWKSRSYRNDHTFVECSNCGFIVENYKAVKIGCRSSEIVGNKWHACPSCTAMMEEPTNE